MPFWVMKKTSQNYLVRLTTLVGPNQKINKVRKVILLIKV